MLETESKDTFFSKKFSINLSGRLMNLDTPRLMGILNVTTDSFYDGGKYNNKKRISERVIKVIEEGADIIDLGACSTRPGSVLITEKEEIQSLISAAKVIRSHYPDIPLSIDTFRSEAARIMINDFSANMINDVTAGESDNKMIPLIAESRVPYVVMHIQGSPATMQVNPSYNNVVNEIILYFSNKIHHLKSQGIMDYIIDPGFGFGKTIEHNYQIINELNEFSILEAPIMVGISRKYMIYKHLETDAENALNGTTALHMVALMKGANILRVHDVKEAAETIKLFKKLTSQTKG